MTYKLYLQEDTLHDNENGDTPAQWIGLNDKNLTFYFESEAEGNDYYNKGIVNGRYEQINVNTIIAFSYSKYDQRIEVFYDTYKEKAFDFFDLRPMEEFAKDLSERSGLTQTFIKQVRSFKRFCSYSIMSLIGFIFCYMIWKDGGCDNMFSTLMLGFLTLFAIVCLALTINAIRKKHDVIVYSR